MIISQYIHVEYRSKVSEQILHTTSQVQLSAIYYTFLNSEFSIVSPTSDLWLWFVVGRCHKGINGIRKGKRPFAEIHSNLRTDITGCSHFPVVAVSEE